MTEFLTWNAYNVAQNNLRTGAIQLLIPIVTILLALVVTAFLDEYGAVDDKVTFDPRYDKY